MSKGYFLFLAAMMLLLLLGMALVIIGASDLGELPQPQPREIHDVRMPYYG